MELFPLIRLLKQQHSEKSNKYNGRFWSGFLRRVARSTAMALAVQGKLTIVFHEDGF